MNKKKKPATSRRAAAKPLKVTAEALAETAKYFHSRGWALGTSGNYSVVLEEKPLRLLITASGLDKSKLDAKSFLEIDEHANVLSGSGRPSAETFLHIAVARARGARCILHTHSVWSTLLSDMNAAMRGIAIEGYEMLKGLEGVKTHLHKEWLPVFENSQDIPKLSAEVETMLRDDEKPHGFLLQGHGLYTWGEDLAQARRHVEIWEFLLEVVGRRTLSQVE